MTPSSAPPLRLSQPSAVSRSWSPARGAGRAPRSCAKNCSERFCAARRAARRSSDLAAELEQVERHQLGRGFRRQLADAAFGRMQPQLQRLERQRVADRDDQLAVEQEAASPSAREASRRLRGNSAPSGLPDLDVSVTSSPSRRARQRKPSHLGSYCQPSPSGSSAASSASIGASAAHALRHSQTIACGLQSFPLRSSRSPLRCGRRGEELEWRSTSNAATARYIDSLGPAALQKAHDYTVGKEWMLLWALARRGARHLADRPLGYPRPARREDWPNGGAICAPS